MIYNERQCADKNPLAGEECEIDVRVCVCQHMKINGTKGETISQYIQIQQGLPSMS